MMIRINLLPVRQAQKRELGRQFLVIVAGVLLLTLGANFLWWRSRDAELQKRVDEIADKRRRIAELDKVIGEVNNLAKKQKEVQAKLDKLDELKRKKAGPVRMMDALSTAMPKKAWISDFVEDKGVIKISGLADSHDDVSELMRSLTSLVWTPKGIGRVIERKRESPTARVELLTGEGSMEDLSVNELGNFFTNVELKSSEVTAAAAKDAPRLVKFEISMAANYAI